ncbi:MAG: MtnX-like HAD-IB family phosphatase [Chloroflexi bacterium]|nr:MtnX-like HAD-IB family phosphatase [Chloroflexota bacterium]
MRPDTPIRTVVQCDFDDTIVLQNMNRVVLERFACGDWLSIEDRYAQGGITVERSNQLQWLLVKGTREEIREVVLSQARVRPGFNRFAESCREWGVRLVVVSNGLDIYIEPVLDRLGLSDLELYSGTVDFTPEGLKVKYVDPSGVETDKGFKLACQEHLRGSADRMVYIGDGTSDVLPALRSDLVLARSTLAAEMEARGHPFIPFETFDDVVRALEEWQGSC